MGADRPWCDWICHEGDLLLPGRCGCGLISGCPGAVNPARRGRTACEPPQQRQGLRPLATALWKPLLRFGLVPTLDLPPRCRLHTLRLIGDERGSLVAVEGGKNVPFDIARAYYIFATAPGVERGFHAHSALTQMAICLSGSCTMVLDDGRTRVDVRLDRPDVGLEIGPMIWREMRDFSSDAVLLVLASAHYDEQDYIRDYQSFLAAVRE